MTEEERKTAKAAEQKRLRLGYLLLGVTAFTFLLSYFVLERNQPFSDWNSWLCLFLVTGTIVSILLLFNFSQIIFDNEEATENDTVKKLVEKLRYRGMLFNNISIIVFIFTLIVIFISFYLLVHPHVKNTDEVAVSLTIRIGASVLLIFLVQILFKVFKYLLRVAAFYNARADAIEFRAHTEIELDKLMDLFTPDKYDITELQQISVFEGLLNAIKGK